MVLQADHIPCPVLTSFFLLPRGSQSSVPFLEHFPAPRGNYTIAWQGSYYVLFAASSVVQEQDEKVGSLHPSACKTKWSGSAEKGQTGKLP